jgi:adenosine deaminase
MLRARSCFLLLIAAAAGLALPPAQADERSTAGRFEESRRDEPSLIAFLRAMPKGGDLHNHPGGAFYPEDGLQEAVAQRLFFNPATNRFERQKSEQNVPAEQLLRDDRLRYQYLNAASMRGFTGDAAARHDHFFRTFGPNVSGWQATPEEVALALVIQRAHMQNIQYIEFIEAPGGAALGRLQAAAAPLQPFDRALERMKPQLDEYVKEARAELDRWDRVPAERLRIPPPLSAADRPITVRYTATAFRAAPDEQTFGTWAGGFALMRADPRVVGVNLVAPEDHPLALQRFDGQMRMLDFLWRRFEQPNISLHAGELNLLLSPLEDLTHHIRDSIEIGHARRIGHGTAIAWENDSPGLLRKMRDEGIAVEICPTSEAVIQGAEGDRHPFLLYRRAGVPLTLNTDDEGILRTNLTTEFVRAVRSWNMSYADLKELARNSLEYSFLPGESLFEGRDYRRVRARFRPLARRGWSPNEEDRKTLAASDRATVQARLERAFVEFER